MKKVLSILLVITLCFALSACSKNEPPSEPESSSPSVPVGSSQPSSTTGSGITNPLTGLPEVRDLSTTRPFALSISNVESALPQSNITGADLCFETLVEGGITRILAFYSKTENMPVTGSIRSARPYWVEIVYAYDAIFGHVGGSEQALSMISSYGIDDFEEDGVTIWRDKQRTSELGSLHACVTDGDGLDAYVKSSGVRTTLDSGSVKPFSFHPVDAPVTPSEGTCQELTVPFSYYVTAVFRYNSTTGQYLKSQFGEKQVDWESGAQVAVKNVLVFETDIYTIDSAGHMAVELDSGTGYYLSNGGYERIKWSRDGYSPFKLTRQNGTELVLNAGKTWVCIVDSSADVTIE